MYQHQALPFDPHNTQFPFYNVGPHNPPCVPNVATHPFVQAAVPAIAGVCADILQARARDNPLRMFTFNMMASNAYNNEDFAALVQGTADYIELMIAKNQYRDPDSALAPCCDQTIELFAADNMRRFPALEYELNPQFIQAASRMINLFDGIRNEMQNFKSRGGLAGVPGFETNYSSPGRSYGYAPQGGGSSYHPARSQTTSAASTRYASNPPMRGGLSPAEASQGHQAGLISGRGTSQPSSAQVLRQPYSQTPEKPMERRAPTPVIPELVPAGAGLLKWQPTPVQPYLPAFDPRRTAMLYKRQNDGSVLAVLKPREELDPNMKYDDHALVDSFGPVPRVYEPMLNDQHARETMGRIQNGLNELNNQAHASLTEDVSPEDQAKSVECRSWAVDPSLESAWLTQNLARLVAAQDGKVPAVFRAYAKITEPVISFADENGFILALSQCRTYLEVRDVMNSRVGEVSQELWSAVNQRATEFVMRLLRNHLSIPAPFGIESFVNDIEDMLAYLSDNYGDVVMQGIERHQVQSIRNLFKPLDEEKAKDVTESLLNGREYGENQPKFTYLVSDVSLTYLNCLSHELNIQLSPDVAVSVQQSDNAELYHLVQDLFDHTDKITSETEGRAGFNRHFIRTNDNRILEASRGHLGSSFFLLSLVK